MTNDTVVPVRCGQCLSGDKIEIRRRIMPNGHAHFGWWCGDCGWWAAPGQWLSKATVIDWGYTPDEVPVADSERPTHNSQAPLL